jgi:hypothetical protein
MTRTKIGSAAAILALMVVAGSPAVAQELEQKVAAAKQAAASNQQSLRSYTWLETTEIAVKGEVKNSKVASVRYGPDGKVQKTTVEATPPPDKKPGVRGRVIEKKTGEMKEEMQAAGALVQQYVPPSPEKIQAAMAAGKVTITPGATTALRIADYVKAGDALTLTLAQGKGIQHIAVNSYLNTPDEAVTLDVQMQSLADGTNYPDSIALAIPSSNIQVRINNSNYQKVTP